MFFELLMVAGVLTIPIWGVVFCLNLISIIEKFSIKKILQKIRYGLLSHLLLWSQPLRMVL